MPAYGNQNASRSVDIYAAGNIDLTKDSAETELKTFYVGNPQIYGVNVSEFTCNLACRIEGDIASNANCKIRAEVNGELAKERTFTDAVTNPEFSFPVAAGDKVTILFTTNAAGAEEIFVVGTRVLILANS